MELLKQTAIGISKGVTIFAVWAVLSIGYNLLTGSSVDALLADLSKGFHVGIGVAIGFFFKS
jgi:hypothetical protein